MLYSIGKDSAVMLHLAMKAFHPGKPPFPLLHVDTTWKFREMYAFRDRMAAELGHRAARAHQPGGRRARHQPVRPRLPGPHRRDEDRGPQAGARRARLRRGLRRRAARRGEVAREGARLLVPLGAAPLGPEEPAARAVAPLQRAQAPRRVDPRLPALQLDRARRLGVHRARGDPGRAALLRRRAARGAARRDAADGRRRPHAARGRRAARAAAGALPHARRLSAHGRGRELRRRPSPRSSRRCARRGPPSARAA